MPKGLMYGLVVALTVTIAGYVILKVAKVDGADTLAIGISSIISIFVAMQNASMSRELEKVKRQTNGMTHHVMQVNSELLRAKTIVDPADVTYDSGSSNGQRENDGITSESASEAGSGSIPERIRHRWVDPDRSG